jgi:hypothetical protein
MTGKSQLLLSRNQFISLHTDKKITEKIKKKTNPDTRSIYDMKENDRERIQNIF